MGIFVPAEPILPGEYIDDELKARNWTQDDLANVMKISRRHVINLIQGKTGITPEIATSLADAFNGGPDAIGWLNLQSVHDLAVLQQNDREVKKRAAIYEKAPVREMQRRGWLPDTSDVGELGTSLCSLLDIQKIDETPACSVAARKSTDYAYDTVAQIAWYKRVKLVARKVHAGTFNCDSMDKVIKNLVNFTQHPADIRRVPKYLAEAGIRLVIVKQLTGTLLDGVATRLDDGSPVVALSFRLDRVDNFWFTLLHELIHIKYGDDSPVDVAETLSTNDLGTLPPMEARANREAANYLVPCDKLNSFILRSMGRYPQYKIEEFAAFHRTHPGIVMGQLHHHPKSGVDYKHLRKLLVPVKSYLVGNALFDGWE